MMKKKTKTIINSYQNMKQRLYNEYHSILSNMHGLREYRDEEKEKRARELENKINQVNSIIAEEKLRDRYGKRYFW